MSAKEKMGKRIQAQKIRLLVLEKIMAKKDLLFGNLCKELTKQDKVNCWKEICAYAHGIGALDINKDSFYLRDVWWPNVRKLTLNKFDDDKAQITAVGKGKELTDVDRAVLNITEKHWPGFGGLNQRLNASGLMEVENIHEVIIEDSGEVKVHVQDSVPCATSKTRSLSPSDSQTSNKHFKQKPTFQKEKIDAPFRTKMDLQVKLLQLQVYQAQLQCRKLEIELGVTHSALTKDIKDSVSVFENQKLDDDNEDLDIYDDSSAMPEM